MCLVRASFELDHDVFFLVRGDLAGGQLCFHLHPLFDTWRGSDCHEWGVSGRHKGLPSGEFHAELEATEQDFGAETKLSESPP